MKRYAMKALLAISLSLPWGALSVAQEPGGQTDYSKQEIGDLLLEGTWYDLYSYRLARAGGESELTSWLRTSIRRNILLTIASGSTAEDLSAKSLETVCLLTDDEELLEGLKSMAGGNLIEDWLTVSGDSIRIRIRYLQESYGGGAGCSVTNENGDVHDTVRSGPDSHNQS